MNLLYFLSSQDTCFCIFIKCILDPTVSRSQLHEIWKLFLTPVRQQHFPVCTPRWNNSCGPFEQQCYLQGNLHNMFEMSVNRLSPTDGCEIFSRLQMLFHLQSWLHVVSNNRNSNTHSETCFSEVQSQKRLPLHIRTGLLRGSQFSMWCFFTISIKFELISVTVLFFYLQEEDGGLQSFGATAGSSRSQQLPSSPFPPPAQLIFTN